MWEGERIESCMGVVMRRAELRAVSSACGVSPGATMHGEAGSFGGILTRPACGVSILPDGRV